MKRTGFVALAAAALLAPDAGQAQVSLGLRAGYSIPMGDAFEASAIGTTFKQKDLFKGEIPLQVDASWRFTKAVSAGLYYAYSFAVKGSQLKQFCDLPGASCSGLYEMSVGAQAALRLPPQGALEPWVGAGAGLQIAHFKVKGFTFPNPIPPPATISGDLDGTLRGWEGRVEAGAAYRLTGQFAVGPYVQLLFGQYRVQDITLGALGTVAGGGVDSPKTHELVTLGLRGTFDL
ncbi:MAG TPA: hypothetical protein VFP50_04875 [Anaeromyxobacteraceae bacterium]|nr:hypothetical protein [Anaeromyxobacteraceae bacterium]